MDEDSNTMATVAMVCGVGVWVLFLINFCLGFVPLLNMLGLLILPIMFFVALGGVITGILGYRQSKVSSVGGGAAMVGLALSVAWFVVEGLLMMLGFGLLTLYVLIMAAAGSH